MPSIKLITLALLLWSGLAYAGPEVEQAKRRAGQLVTRGNELFEAKKYPEALEKFEEAYRTFPSPKIHYNLARTLAACERTDEAIDQYEKFLSDAGLARDDERYLKAREELDRLEDQFGKLAFNTAVNGSMLTLDEHPEQPVPEAAIRVRPGTHRVVIETPDGRRFVESVEVAAGETLRVHVLFPTIAPPPPPKPAIVAETTPPKKKSTKKPKEEESGSVFGKWWFWTAIGAAAIAIGTGVGVSVGSRAQTFERDGELDVSSTSEWERF